MSSKQFLEPDISFSDDEEDVSLSSRKISNKIKKTKTNKDAIKHPNTFYVEDDEDKGDDSDVIISEDESPSSSQKRKSFKKTSGPSSKRYKRPRIEDSDEEFVPDDVDSDDNDDIDSVASEDLSDENISDSDYDPDPDEEIEAQNSYYFDSQEDEGNATINLSSDNESPEKTQVIHSNSKEFWNKVEELKTKGFSIQQAGGLNRTGGSDVRNNSPLKGGNVPPNHQKLAAFCNLYINFDHDKRCLKKCFMMEERQRQTLAELKNPRYISPDLVKACIKVVNCNAKMGDVQMAKQAVNLTSQLGNVPGIPALCQAMISGVKAQLNSIAQLEGLEKQGMASMRSKEFTSALETLDKALALAGSCLRLKMARGDCLAHLGRYVEGARAASSILQQDPRNVGALFLRGFCLYHKNNIERAVSHFQQVLQINKEHERAKTLLGKARLFKDKRDQAARALTEGRLEDAEWNLTEALKIDVRNKGTNANILAERAEVYSKLDRLDCCIKDCEEALALDQSCLAALLQRAKCHMESNEWEQAVRVMERMNSRDRHNQQAKVKAGEAAKAQGNFMEAHRLFSEAMDIDKHNQKYKHLLKEAKQSLLLQTRVDYYAVLDLEKTVGDSEIRKAYFKKSKEYHPDRHANESEDIKEEFSRKFKLAKEAYELLSDHDKRKMYDSGRVKPPPGGWYQDVEQSIAQFVQSRGPLGGRGALRGVRGGMRGGVIIRGAMRPQLRGQVRPPIRLNHPIRGARPIRGTIRPGVRPMMRPGVRPGMRSPIRPALRPGMRPGVGIRPNRPRAPINVTRASVNGARLLNGQTKLNGISITPIGADTDSSL